MRVVSQIELVPVSEIKPYHRNVRQNDKTISLLVENMPKVGFNVPIVLDRQNVIVKGHARFAAAIRLGLDRLPCVYTDNDEETNKFDRLADNKIQESSRWIEDILSTELASINLGNEYDLAALGFKLTAAHIEAAINAPEALGNGAGNYDLPEGFRLPGNVVSPDDFITQADVGKTAPVKEEEYYKCTCDKCGNVMLIKK